MENKRVYQAIIRSHRVFNDPFVQQGANTVVDRVQMQMFSLEKQRMIQK